jgi:hypothetical protein
MLREEEQDAHYLSKAREDPYSLALLNIVNIRIQMIRDQLESRIAINLTESQVFHLLGQLYALKGMKDLPEEAQTYLDELPEAEVEGEEEA